MAKKVVVEGLPHSVEDWYEWYYVKTGEDYFDRKSLGDMYDELFGYHSWNKKVRVTVELIDTDD